MPVGRIHIGARKNPLHGLVHRHAGHQRSAKSADVPARDIPHHDALTLHALDREPRVQPVHRRDRPTVEQHQLRIHDPLRKRLSHHPSLKRHIQQIGPPGSAQIVRLALPEKAVLCLILPGLHLDKRQRFAFLNQDVNQHIEGSVLNSRLKNDGGRALKQLPILRYSLGP
jgi:hypothetical protein